MAVERIGVSLEGPLLKAFDAWVAEHGFASRSEALRGLVREALAARRVEAGGDVAGTITYLYRHDVGGVTHRILHRQHDFLETIRATAHTHLGEELCLEALLVRGPVSRIHQLADRLRSTRGVLFQDMALAPPDLQ